jgi:hypothetical protein
LHLGGNWLNSGTFNMGNSTIDFTGPDDASILTGGSPESFYKIEVSKNNSAKLHIQGTVHVTGIGTE